MKTIFYVVLLCITLIIPGLYVRNQDHTIFLYPESKDVTGELLNLSAGILSSRLKIYAPNSAIRVSAEKSRIKIRIPGDLKISIPDGLLTSPGSVGFHETLTAGEIASILEQTPPSNPSEVRLACSSRAVGVNADSIKAILESGSLFEGYRLMWGAGNDKSGFCIYAVRTSPSLDRSDIESVGPEEDDATRSESVMIRFRPAAAGTWAELTRKNLGKPLALVIDDRVFYTPMVKTAMESGLCEISGSFSREDIYYLLAMAGSEKLPARLIAR